MDAPRQPESVTGLVALLEEILGGAPFDIGEGNRICIFCRQQTGRYTPISHRESCVLHRARRLLDSLDPN